MELERTGTSKTHALSDGRTVGYAVYGDPPGLPAVKTAIRDADAVLIATPEDRHGLAGVPMNALDWASRPPAILPSRS